MPPTPPSWARRNPRRRVSDKYRVGWATWINCWKKPSHAMWTMFQYVPHVWAMVFGFNLKPSLQQLKVRTLERTVFSHKPGLSSASMKKQYNHGEPCLATSSPSTARGNVLVFWLHNIPIGIQVPSQKVIGDYLCRLGGPKYLLRRCQWIPKKSLGHVIVCKTVGIGRFYCNGPRQIGIRPMSSVSVKMAEAWARLGPTFHQFSYCNMEMGTRKNKLTVHPSTRMQMSSGSMEKPHGFKKRNRGGEKTHDSSKTHIPDVRLPSRGGRPGHPGPPLFGVNGHPGPPWCWLMSCWTSWNPVNRRRHGEIHDLTPSFCLLEGRRSTV